MWSQRALCDTPRAELNRILEEMGDSSTSEVWEFTPTMGRPEEIGRSLSQPRAGADGQEEMGTPAAQVVPSANTDKPEVSARGRRKSKRSRRTTGAGIEPALHLGHILSRQKNHFRFTVLACRPRLQGSAAERFTDLIDDPDVRVDGPVPEADPSGGTWLHYLLEKKRFHRFAKCMNTPNSVDFTLRNRAGKTVGELVREATGYGCRDALHAFEQRLQERFHQDIIPP